MVTNKAQIFLFTLLVVASNHKVIAQAPAVSNPVPPAVPTGNPAAVPVKTPALSPSTTGTSLGKDDSQQILQKINQLAEECGNLQINCTEVYDPGNSLTILEKMLLQTVQSVCVSIKQNVISVNSMQCNQGSLTTPSTLLSGSSTGTPSSPSPVTATPPPPVTGTPPSPVTGTPPSPVTGTPPSPVTATPPPPVTVTPSTPAT